MRAMAEGAVGGDRAVEIDRQRILVDLLVEVHHRRRGEHQIAGPDRRTADLNVFSAKPDGAGEDHRIAPQQLLDDAVHLARIFADPAAMRAVVLWTIPPGNLAGGCE